MAILKRILAAAIGLLVMVVVLVPGDVDEFEYHAFDRIVVRRGWPWTYLTFERPGRLQQQRTEEGGLILSENEDDQETPPNLPLGNELGSLIARAVLLSPGWLCVVCIPYHLAFLNAYASLWTIRGAAFSPGWLTADVLVLSVILFAAYWLGRRMIVSLRGFRVSLKAWMAFCLAASVMLGVAIGQWRSEERQLVLAAELDSLNSGYHWSSGLLPDWLAKHFGDPLDAWSMPRWFGARIEIVTGGNILPAMSAYKNFPGMEGATYYYYDIPKNSLNAVMVSRHMSKFKTPPDFFTAGGFSVAMALVTALKKTAGDTNTDALINAMEGMSFDTPKGQMTFRKEDHQAMQSMYHFKIKVDPAVAWGIPELVREIKPEDMNVPIRNKR